MAIYGINYINENYITESVVDNIHKSFIKIKTKIIKFITDLLEKFKLFINRKKEELELKNIIKKTEIDKKLNIKYDIVFSNIDVYAIFEDIKFDQLMTFNSVKQFENFYNNMENIIENIKDGKYNVDFKRLSGYIKDYQDMDKLQKEVIKTSNDIIKDIDFVKNVSCNMGLNKLDKVISKADNTETLKDELFDSNFSPSKIANLILEINRIIFNLSTANMNNAIDEYHKIVHEYGDASDDLFADDILGIKKPNTD